MLEVALATQLIISTFFAIEGHWDKSIYAIAWSILIQIWIYRKEDKKLKR